MIYAQRPDATACAEYDLWNEKMGRYVRRGSKGIALVDDSGDRPRLRYVFDISDTGTREHSRTPWLWQLEERHLDSVQAMLERTYDVSGDDLAGQLTEVAGKLAEEYWTEHQQDFFYIVDGSFLEEYDEFNIGVQFKAAATVSITYPHSAAYAREHGELEQYRASNNVNLQCKESIEAAVREHFDGMYLSHDAAKGVIETYGMERVSMVLSNTIQLQDWDGRYSQRNKEWAKTIPNDNPETVRCGYALNSHPAVLDGFIDLVREEQQRSRTQREKLEPSRPSVRDKLKQELPANKSAAPKKRELER